LLLHTILLRLEGVWLVTLGRKVRWDFGFSLVAGDPIGNRYIYKEEYFLDKVYGILICYNTKLSRNRDILYRLSA
jgi:hypothetical protein